MNKLSLSLFLTVLSLAPLSLSAMNPAETEDPWNKFNFHTIVTALKERKLIEFEGDEYAVLIKEPSSKSALYLSGLVRMNPCYKNGLGPHLLKVDQIDTLPQGVQWIPYSSNTSKFKSLTYVTLRYTANNNPHWEHIYSHPKPFDDLNNHYWHTETNMISTMPIRTVNFLLKKVSE